LGVAINTSVSSATLVRALKTATANETSTINKLASGKRINRAADDAAGLTVNEKLTSKLRGITKAQGNIGDALSVIQNTYGGLATAMEHLQNIRELMVKAANGTNGINEINYIQSEINDNVETILVMRDAPGSTMYGVNGGFSSYLDNGYGTEVFCGADPPFGFNKDFQVGPDPNDVITLDFTNSVSPDNSIDISVGIASAGSLGEGTGLGLWQLNIGGTVQSIWEKNNSLPPTKIGNLKDIDTMIKNVSRMMSVTDKYNAKFTAAFDKLEADKISYSGFQSQVQDTDYAKTASDLTQNQIQKQSAVSILSQANSQVGFVLNLLP
jgi:flagellin